MEISTFWSNVPAENIIVLAMMFFSIFSVVFSILVYKNLIDRKKQAIKKQFREEEQEMLSSSEKRKSELLKPRMRVANLGAPPKILFKNSTNCQPIVASIDFLDKDQYAFILLCYWGEQ